MALETKVRCSYHEIPFTGEVLVLFGPERQHSCFVAKKDVHILDGQNALVNSTVVYDSLSQCIVDIPSVRGTSVRQWVHADDIVAVV